MRLILLTLFIGFFSVKSHSACIAQRSPVARMDIITALLESGIPCPRDVREFKNILSQDGLKSLPALVANRGFHNPNAGSFSVFESSTGPSKMLGRMIRPEHLYFGHFTGVENRQIVLDQSNGQNKLLIEAIAYDFSKGLYNFYELIGSASGPQWFYRGDTNDIFEDNKMLKIGARPQFGSRLRCSACHTSGGPIMKEITFPHNDWWTKRRGLPFGINTPSPEFKGYLNQFIDAAQFSRNVVNGIRLIENRKVWARRTLKEKLRPLFCTTEINLKSDVSPLREGGGYMQIPTDAFVDPHLVKESTLKMHKGHYLAGLTRLGANFPETREKDADHGYLVPVKSEQIQFQVSVLIKDRIVDQEFVLDVLSVDFKNPLLSPKRCELLKLVPESLNWKKTFIENLDRSILPHAKELGQKLKVADGKKHQELALQYLKDKQAAWTNAENVLSEVMFLNHLRTAVFNDEISKNPRGQILEPGFRVIFPVMRK